MTRPGPSYTVDTLAQLRAEVGAERALVWILGFDQLQRLPTWHRWREIPDLAHLAYARRGDGVLDAQMARFVDEHAITPAQLHRSAGGGVLEFPMQPVACSASEIRLALQDGDPEPARRFLAPEVLRFVQSHQLYGTHGH